MNPCWVVDVQSPKRCEVGEGSGLEEGDLVVDEHELGEGGNHHARHHGRRHVLDEVRAHVPTVERYKKYHTQTYI